MPDVLTEELFSKVAGTTFRHDLPWEKITPWMPLLIEREPMGTKEEPHDDENALALYVLVSGQKTKIGFINRRLAGDLSPYIDNGTCSVSGFVTEVTGGSGRKENMGINIKLMVRHTNMERLNKLNPFI